MQPWEYRGDGSDRPDAPLLVYGLRITESRLAGVADKFVLDGVTLLRDPGPDAAVDGIALAGTDGVPLAVVRWRQPTPGTDVLRAWAPAAIVLGVLGLALTGVLLRYVVGNAASLRQAMRRAEASDRAKSVLLANVSHELRTPLNGIIGASEILEDADIAPEDREMTEIIRHSAEALLVLIEDLIQVARADAGEIVVELAPTDLASFLRNASAGPRVLAQQKGLRFEMAVDGSVPPLLLDARLMRQCVINLLGNAVKFSEEGRIRLEARWEDRPPDAAGDLTVVVEDDRPGIAPQLLNRIFERFSQADDSSRRRHGGTGLGLSITRSLMEAMGGRVIAESAPGVGSRFVLRVPCAVAARAEEPLARAA